MGSGLITVAAFLLALTLLVFVHEMGHFLAARAAGIQILRFSIGFGPTVFSRRFGRDGTEWALCAIPLGGYVKMLGQQTGQALVLTEAQRARSFDQASLRARVGVIAAGPLANLALATLLYAALSWNGVPEIVAQLAAPPANSVAARSGLLEGDRVLTVNQQSAESWNALRLQLFDAALSREPIFLEILRQEQAAAVVLDAREVSQQALEQDPLEALGFQLAGVQIEITGVLSGSAAERAGLQSGDIVRRVDGDAVAKAATLIEHVRARPGYPSQLEIERQGALLEMSIVPDSVTDPGSGAIVGRIGASLATRAQTVLLHQGFFEGLLTGAQRTAAMTDFSLRMFGHMLLGQLSWSQLSGPITIADQAGRTAQMGFNAYIAFLALISVSLGTLNLLPLPMLDGGHLVYCAIEAIRGKPLSNRTLEVAQRAGLALIVALSVVALFNDLVRLVGP